MDFIPLNSKSDIKLTLIKKRKRSRRSNPDNSSKCPRDKVLLKRVRQVVDGMKSIDVDSVLEELKKYFPEYRRRKIVDFRISITQIIKYIQDAITPESSIESSEFSEENCESAQYQDTNLVNRAISDMYKNSPKPTEALNGLPTTNESKKKLEVKTDEEKLVKKTKKQKIEDKKPSLKKKNEILLQESQVTFANFGGIDKVQEEMWELLVQMRHPEVYEHLGVLPPRGFLLHGPPGCGKTLLAHAIAGELKLPLLKMAATELVTGVSGESEEKIRELFDQAISSTPCILFIDEIDAITPKRETAQREMERRIVAQLLSCLDDLSQKAASTRIVVVGATNRADSLDPALRRAGRFDHEISLGIPDEVSRIKILKVLCQNLKMCEGFDFHDLAHRSPGYVGADLMALTRKAATCAIRRVMDAAEKLKEFENSFNADVVSKCSSSWLKNASTSNLSLESSLKDAYIEKNDFLVALKTIQPSAKREGFATVPDTSWEDVGALQHIREELQMAIMAPVSHREAFETLGLTTSSGILLCGPPGCGKTLLAKAIANESGLNFISVKGPELLNMYVGESERAVRQCFQRARNAAPCVIFFDELDALCPRRTKDTAVSGASDRVVNQLLTEMDGMDTRRQVFVLAATNRPDIIDPAVMRPGRLDKILYVGLPLPNDRIDILRTLTKNGTKPPLNDDVRLEDLGQDKRCEGFTGADLSALVREASSLAIKDLMQNPNESQLENLKIKASHFEEAFGKVRPSVSQQDQKIYEKMRNISTFPSNV